MNILIATEKPFAAAAVSGIREIIETSGHQLQLLERYTEKQQLLEAVATADALIVRSDILDVEVFDAAPRLQIVVRAGAGVDSIDLAAATAHNVVVMNTPGQNANAVAELVFAYLLFHVRHRFNGKIGSELKGKRIGLLAYGNVASEVARIAKGFGMDVHAYDFFHRVERIESDGVYAEHNLYDLVQNCDIVSLHPPATPRTIGFVNREMLELMKPGAVLLNTARKEIINEDGSITTKTNTGDMVTCNLNSISLGRIIDEELEENIALQIRMLDNVISINQAPVPESRMTSDKYRAIGLGTSGYHHYLVNHDIQWESDEHIEAADKLFENIAYYAIKASMELAKEKGAYPAFKGSEWETGEYFTRRGYTSDRWKQLAADVAKYGIRNGYLMAVAPTGSTSNIANTTAGIDPIFKKFFIEEKKGSFTPKTAPDLNDKTFWLYKEAHTIDQQWSIKACGIRQRHIDQAQSFNLYITPQMKAKEVLDLYM